MYIGEVIRRAQSYCPSEYDINEMYSWCDEVSSMLAIEDRNLFVKETLFTNIEGTLLLPKGVSFENVCSVMVGGKVLKKEDLRNINPGNFVNSKAEVVYLKPYEPIRIVNYSGDVTLNKEIGTIKIRNNDFRIGDSVRVTIEDAAVDMPILDIVCEDGYAVLYVPVESIGGLPDAEITHIERIVTDKTVCDAPFDGMYIDYIIAKISMYQRDFQMYNQFMASFNSRLGAYKRWITNQLPQASRALKNWW